VDKDQTAGQSQNQVVYSCVICQVAVVDCQGYKVTFSNRRMIWSNSKKNYVPKSRTSYNDSRNYNVYTDSGCTIVTAS